MTDTTREAVARAIYESYGFAYDGRTINGKGEPYGEWAHACAAADAVAALRPAQDAEGWRDIASDPPPSLDRILAAGWQKQSGTVRGYWWIHEDFTDEEGRPMDKPDAIKWQPLPSPPRTLESK